MNFPVLAFIVIGQIAVFQFAAIAFTRTLFAAFLGHPPGEAAREADAYLRRATRRRFFIGGALVVLAVVSVALAGDPARKLLLAAASLASTAAFVYAVVRDRRAIHALREALPESGVRRASLGPRSVSQWVHWGWDAVPVLILVATVVVAAVFARNLDTVPPAMWVIQVIQAAFVTGALLYRFGGGTAVPRLATLRNQPELTLQFAERLAASEMRYFMAAKVGVTLLLGVGVVHVALEALDHGAAPALGAARWAIVGGLIVLFAGFVWQTSRLTKHVQTRAGGPEHRLP